MYQSEAINELATALAKAQAEICHAKKDEANPYFKSKYADLPAVIDAAKAALTKNGLSVIQAPNIMEDGRVYLVTQLNHASGQWIRSSYPIKPIKDDPQGMGSALTYARRYAYASLVGVAAAGEDDDGNAASGNTSYAANDSKPSGKSPFSNSAQRNQFQNNVIMSFEQCEKESELVELGKLNKPKITEMRESGQEYDKLAVEEIEKRYQAKLTSLRAEALADQQSTETKARK
jgi:hypothetical protein